LQHGHASPWARALTSHSRHAGVTAEAALWFHEKDSATHIECVDIDNDGEREWIVKNQHLFAVITPQWGGRIVALYSVSGDSGSMVVGNPCDDWNWMEELNRSMDVPRNHPGAFADVGFEHDRYECEVVEDTPERSHLRLTNVQKDSGAFGMVKDFELTDRACSLFTRYQLAPQLGTVSVDCGLSPDYLSLLRKGVSELKRVRTPHIRGWRASRIAAWIKPVSGFEWDTADPEVFGHGYLLRLRAVQPECAVALGVTPRRLRSQELQSTTRSGTPVALWQ
jgi:hypothetical protein